MSSRSLLPLRRPAAACFGAALASAVFVFACTGLKVADDPGATGDGGGNDDGAPGTMSEGGATTKDGAPGDSSSADAGAPPTDFECMEPWNKATKTKPECAPRQVKDVVPTAPIDATGVSIARTPAGRVGIVFNDEQGAETGELHLAHFTPASMTYAAAKVVVQATGFAFHNGYRTKLAASGPDTLAVLSYDMDDDSQSGELHLRSLVKGVEPLTDDLIASAIKNPTELAVASDSTGNTYVTYRVSTGATTAKLSSKKKAAGGAFTALPDLTTALLPQEAPGVGGGGLFVDSGGQLHLLYHFNQVAQHSTPVYHALAGTAWTAPKTVDNNVIDGLSGFSARIAVYGTKKYALYYYRKALQSIPVTADLRLASWDGAMDMPTVEILDQQIPSDDALYPGYRAAVAVDKFGLVHFAQIRPTSATAGFLEYRRQIFVAGGGRKWLTDIVDNDVFSNQAQAYVDLVVDDSARPHIAYISAKDGKVKYATRFDR